MYMKKLKITTILVWLIPLILIGLILYYPFKINIIESQVTNYLENTKGYNSSEINSVEGQISKLPTFSVNVIFEDEPHLVYRYKVENGKVEQMGVSLSKNGESNDKISQKYHENELELKHREMIK